MEQEAQHGNLHDEVKELREGAEVLEGEAVDLAVAAAFLEAEADRLEDGHRETHFKVDGEPYKTIERELTAKGILKIAGLDPALRYLDEISPEKVSFKDKGEETIRMIDHMEFISLRVGPTPVS